MANTILVPLCFLAILAAVFTAEDRGCCRNKTVGTQTYGLLEEGTSTSSPSWPSDCPTSCIYSTFLPGDNKRYCFAPGNLTSVCTSSSGLVTSTSTTTSTTSTTSTKTTTTTAPTTTTTNDPGLVYSQPAGELELKRDTLLATIPLFGPHWEVTFEFYPKNYDYSGWTNILHLTDLTENSANLGGRTPAIFYHPYYGLQVVTAIGSDPISNTYINPPPAVGQWTRIHISQLMTGSSTTFSVKIGEAAPVTKNNPTPKAFEGVKVYATNPWSTPAQAGNIRGLKITTQ